MSHSSLDLLRRLWRFLSTRRRWQIVLVGALMLAGTFLEMLSLGAVVPFLATLMDPAAALENPVVTRAAGVFGVRSPAELLAPLTIAFIVLAVLAGVGRLGLLWATHRMAFLLGADLSNEIFRRTLYQPYSVHVLRNSSQLVATITKKVSETTRVFQQLLVATTSLVMATGITTALLLISPIVASLAAILFGGGYVLIARLSRRRLLRNSRRIKEASVRLVKTLQEGLGGIRDVLLDGTQPAHCAEYRRVDRPLRRAVASNGFISSSPRVIVDALGIACIAALAFAFTMWHGGAKAVVPTLGVLALGAQRLLPAFQHIFNGYASFVGHHASLAQLVEMLEQPLPDYVSEPPPEPLDFRSEVRFEDVHFRYSETGPWVINGVNLVIHKGSRVGFVGKTGSGKSTLLDLVMGLLSPTQGRILVDGTPISNAHGRSWQRAIAHVPQAIFLSDTSIAENIAFGVPTHKVDMERVRQAAGLARMHDFVTALPDGYQTQVGERGVRLSGGQRQRMGIARALYKQASVLIFDEATSALDSVTERELMDGIEALSRDLTILMVAHRIGTVQQCDQIVVVDQGRVVAAGPYSSLLESSDIFRSLTSHSRAG